MCRHRKLFVILGILSCLLEFGSSTQFLLNAPRAIYDFVTLASSSAFQNSSPLSRIVDYRSKEAKRAELENQKENLEHEDLLLERQQEENEENGGRDMNEASPSFLQKKINKIIAKLRILAQLRNAFSYSPEKYPAEEPGFETSTTQSNVTITFEDPKTSRNGDGKNVNSTDISRVDVGHKNNNETSTNTEENGSTEENNKASTEIQENGVAELKYEPKKESEVVHHVYSIARRAKIRAEGPEKIDLEVEKPSPIRRSDSAAPAIPKHGHKKPSQNLLNNQNKSDPEFVESTLQGSLNGVEISQNGGGVGVQSNVVNTIEATEQERPSRFGSVGVFFAELLATMVGLAYGAVAQFTSSNAAPATL